MIDTRKVKGRRQLRFETVAAAIQDAETLAAADRASTLRPLGNWTLGQALGHIAFFASAPFDGYPAMPQMPWLLRKLVPLFKGWILNKGLPVGTRIPGTKDGTFGTELLPTDAALAAYRRAFERLAAQRPTSLNPIFGELSHEEWIKFNLRHAELHQSFFLPGP
jgi:hypothetical protein